MDLNALSTLLQSRLINNGSAVIPGIGTLVIEERPSEIAENGKSITAPHKEVRFVFCPRAEILDQAQNYSLPDDIAIWRDSAQSGSSIRLPGIGAFTKESSGIMSFSAAKEISEACSRYSLEPILLEVDGTNFIFADNPEEESPASDTLSGVHVAEETVPDTLPGQPVAEEPEEVEPTMEPFIKFVEEEDEDEPIRSADADFAFDDVPARVAQTLVAETAPAPIAQQPAPAKPAEPAGPASQEPVAQEPAAQKHTAAVAKKAAAPAEPEQIQTAPATKPQSMRLTLRILISCLVTLAVLAILVVLIYVFRDELRPLLESLLYSDQERELLNILN